MMTYRVTMATEPTRKPWRLEAQGRTGPSRIIETYETTEQAQAALRHLEANLRDNTPNWQVIP